MVSTLTGMQAQQIDMTQADNSITFVVGSGHVNLDNNDNDTMALTSSTPSFTLATTDKMKSLAIATDGVATKLTTSGTKHQFVGASNTSNLTVDIQDPCQTVLTTEGSVSSLNIASNQVKLSGQNVTIAAPVVELRSSPADTNKHVAFMGDYHANSLQINPDMDFAAVTVQAPLHADGGIVASSMSTPDVMSIKSGSVIRLDAPHVIITGRLNVVSKQDVTVQDKTITLGTRSNPNIDLPDSAYDGAGIILDNSPDNQPASQKNIETSFRWRAQEGHFDKAGGVIAPENRSRWELEGGGLFMKGTDGTSFMFIPVDGKLNLYKMETNADGTETATLLQGLA